MMRIGVLDGGVEAVSHFEVSTPTQRLYISEKQDRWHDIYLTIPLKKKVK